MKLGEIFRFELGYQLRRLSTWLAFAILVVFAFLAIGGDDDAPSVIARITVFGSLIWLLVAATVAGEAATRDAETRMHPLIYTAPVTRGEYLGGRFFAAFLLNALILLAVPAGILLAARSPGMEAEILGPFRPAAYITAYLFIALPNAFVATAIQFSWAALHRRAIASYLGSLLLFVAAYIVGPFVALKLGLRQLAKLLDPIGVLGIVSELANAWTPIEKNTRLVALEGSLLWNRLLWVGIALGMLAFTYFRFRFAYHTETPWLSRIRGRPGAHSPAPAEREIARSTPISVPHVRPMFDFATHARQTLAIAWDSFRSMAKSWAGLILVPLLAWVVVLVPHHLESMEVPLLPRTEHVITFLTAPLTNPQTAWVFIPLLIVLYAGELVWREREAGLSEIADAAPVPEWVLFLGKFLGLGLVLVALMALLTAAGMLVQARMGYSDFEIGLYLQTLFGLQLTGYLLFALLALVVHVLVDHKYVGHLVALIAYGFIAFASALGIEHHLLVYGSDPGWSYTDMRGFGPFLGPWLWFKLYWAAWALLLAVVARLLWVRSTEGGLGVRLQLARHRFTRRTAGAAAAAIGLILMVGGFIYYNTNVLNEYSTASERMELRAEYERRYGRYEGIPQPRLTGTNLHVEIYPEQRAVEIRGTYRLVNLSAVAIDSIHLATASAVETGAVSFDRAAARVLVDEGRGHRIYALEEPLQPGDSLQLSFAVRFARRGFHNSGVDASVVANGTYFTNQDWLPGIGYQPRRELSEAEDRRAHGLAPRPALPSLYDIDARQHRADAERIAFEAVVGTDEDQIAVAPGALRETWMEGGRRYFRYSTDAPIQNQYAFFSADYAVHEGRWNDVAIQIFHHPGHAANLERMLRSVRASLNYYTEQFGPYPYRQISLVEHPGHGLGMHAEATLIDYEEGFSLLTPEDQGRALDLPFWVVAHEVAHQWWGVQLAPAYVEGYRLLSESLATYSAMRVVEETYGYEHLRRILGRLRLAYGAPRTRAAVPLLRTSDPFHSYRKGPFAIYALSRYIGEERVNRALRRLLETHGSGAPPLPTSLDLYRELQAVTPDSLRSLLHDLFAANTFWELETEAVRAEPTATGAWRVTLDVQARKVVVDTAGIETEVPMDDLVEVGVFAAAEADEDSGKPLYLQKHRVHSGKQTITVTVPRKPARAGIDPNHLLIDLEIGDNITKVKIES